MTQRPTREATSQDLVGTSFEVEVGPVAHGGHCVARHEGRVVFVRHALPGERVAVVVTEGGAASRFLRADAIEILERSADRVDAPCPWAGPGRCGGCDWQHANLDVQRRLKADVVSEQLRRLGGLDVDVVVEPVPGDAEGLSWRTRVQYAVDTAGRAGLRPHRSHDVLPIDRCLIAHPLVQAADVTGRVWPGRSAVEVAASVATGKVLVVPQPPRADEKPGHLTERAGGRHWRVTGSGFWQVHPGAADALLGAVLEATAPLQGEVALDLYAGVGLFAAGLAARVGSAGQVVAVEADPQACRDARRNLHDVRNVEIVEAEVDRWIGSADAPSDVDIVVLDPPRSGAGRSVVERIAGMSPRRVAYVACDPAALARDGGTFRQLSYDLVALRAFDLFPMTHHVECVALLEPTEPPPPASRRS